MPIDPFTSWLRLMRGASMFAETLVASGSVIGHRSGTIGEAIANPGAADVVELQRMVGEKATSFAEAGASLARDWWKLQADLAAQTAAVGEMLTAGSLPSARAVRAINARSRRLGDHSVASATRALRPIHATATANARRLGKRRKS